MPGVHYVLTGEELAKAVEPMMNGLDTPKVRRYSLAVGQTRYMGEWIAAVVADTRALAEDAAELVEVEYEPLDFVLDAERAIEKDAPLVHAEHGTNVLLDKLFVWGEVEKHFAESPRKLDFRVTWGRSATVPIETFGVVASWDPWREMLDVWASIQMPKYSDQIARAMRMAPSQVRVHQDVDVGGSYGVKRGIKHTVLVTYLAKKLGRPVRLQEDRLENMRSGDMHGPDRIFDVSCAFDDRGVIRSLKMRALDQVGAYAGRSPFQLGKPIGAIVGPYTIESAQYHAVSVLTNKAAQEAVRGFGQAPTNYAIETMLNKVADAVGIDRMEVRRRNMIRKEQFPYLIPSGTTYDSGDYHTVADKTLASVSGWNALIAERDRLRKSGLIWPASASPRAWSLPAATRRSSRCSNPANTTSTWMDSVRIMVDAMGSITATIHTTSAGQAHEQLCATALGEVLEIDPDRFRIVRADSLASLPSNSPVGSRMAIMLGGACFHAAGKLKTKLMRIGAKRFGVAETEVEYSEGRVRTKDGDKTLQWAELVHIAHRHFHELPDGMEPGLEVSAVYQVPTGTKLPENDRVQMYPAHSFEFHLVLLTLDPVTAKPEFRRYVIGHDCGVQINPLVVKGMTLGGIAHGLGATLLGRVRLRRRRPDDEPVADGLPAAVVARGAQRRDRASLHALARDGVRPEGLGRERLPWLARRHLERDQRCGGAARDFIRQAADPHLGDGRCDCGEFEMT